MYRNKNIDVLLTLLNEYTRKIKEYSDFNYVCYHIKCFSHTNTNNTNKRVV